ncbi:MAG: helix-turn-helix domain-containing protein [Gemmatimonadetes bacterium]|nr:helix-turn-helix domain-containing protein [Gemmatimonadota bacterium]MYF17503.1 helix-turn-helix domain-containing protein [Gemmatimonadota bacterium]
MCDSKKPPVLLWRRGLFCAKAEEALKNTSYTLSEIAYLCGFASLSTFSKVFKEKYEVSPSTYRKK